jgi:hypothetical protein
MKNLILKCANCEYETKIAINKNRIKESIFICDQCGSNYFSYVYIDETATIKNEDDKVYCKDCVYYKYEEDLNFYTDIHFKDSNKTIKHGDALCVSKIVEEVSYSVHPKESIKTRVLYVDDCLILNKNNICRYYTPTFMTKAKKIAKIKNILFA